MDSHLEKLLSAILKSDPSGELDDQKREAMAKAVVGMHSPETYQAVWQFSNSISDEFKRSFVLHKLVAQVLRGFQFDLAERIATSIPLLYWQLSSLAAIASDLLKRDKASSGTNSWFRQKAFELLHAVEKDIPLVPEEDGDRASIGWEAGLTLVEAGELDWAERIAQSPKYSAEATEVLLRIVKTRSSRGEKDRALQILNQVAGLIGGAEGNWTSRAFDLLNASELFAELGDPQQSRLNLNDALEAALAGIGTDIDAQKCLSAIAIGFAKQRDFDAASQAACQITQPARRAYALQKIEEIRLGVRPQSPPSSA